MTMSLKIALPFLLAALIAIQAAAQNVRDPKGGVTLDVSRANKDGTRVRVDGRQEIFRTNDGRTRGEAYGHAERTFGGRNDGQKSSGGGFRTDHSWRNGEASFDVNRMNRDGTKFRVDGRQEIFRTNDGRTRGEAYGHAERTYGGTYDGARSQGGGVKLEHRWK
ncbi:uncharacterized protein LOC106664366 isoform X1 [Cimex lectularius]|uniref:CPR type cuticle protein n=1 Tax=Cimex lectularius TaxID=79782 RepID=A0A8I6TF44_CIMLE|nr:uncharacterized protein LOC106664366 isoform X1 [Cimex lectularius]